MNRIRTVLSSLFLFLFMWIHAQNPGRFEQDIIDLQRKYDSIGLNGKPTLLFTGSSSIRLWSSLEASFPEYQVINTGFGGSQTSDLLWFIDQLVLRYEPKQVLIYEGDNDIEKKKKPRKIINTTREVVKMIKEPGTVSSIVLISAKPSIARWRLKGKYKRFNRKLKNLCESDPMLQFANVWDPMLTGKKLRKDLFIEDGLHMNDKGYEIWYNVLINHID